MPLASPGLVEGGDVGDADADDLDLLVAGPGQLGHAVLRQPHGRGLQFANRLFERTRHTAGITGRLGIAHDTGQVFLYCEAADAPGGEQEAEVGAHLLGSEVVRRE